MGLVARCRDRAGRPRSPHVPRRRAAPPIPAPATCGGSCRPSRAPSPRVRCAWLVSCTVPERIRVTPSCVIDDDELEWRFTASGGPGGQHANTANTKAEVRFDIAASPSLGPRQRARLLERLGPVVRVVASDRRSQAQNRELALDRLKSKLAAAAARRSGAPPVEAVAVGGREAARGQASPERTQSGAPALVATTTDQSVARMRRMSAVR